MPDKVQHCINILNILTTSILHTMVAFAAYLFDGNIHAARAVLALYSITLATRIWNITRKWQMQKIPQPGFRSTFWAVLTFKAWQPGYLQLSMLEDKMLCRWSIYIVWLLVAQQCKDIHPELAKIVPAAAIAVMCYWEIRCIFHSYEIGGFERAARVRRYMDELPQVYLPQLLRRILSIFVGNNLYGGGYTLPPTQNMPQDKENDEKEGQAPPPSGKSPRG